MHYRLLFALNKNKTLTFSDSVAFQDTMKALVNVI